MAEASITVLYSAHPVHPVQPRVCSVCEHAYLGQYGVYCGVYKEEIQNERVAEECDEFDGW